MDLPAAPVQVVWFKRDLRVDDHAPLLEAAARGPVLCVHVVEPEALARDDFDPVHLGFALEALADLDAALRARGAGLTVRVGRLPEAFESLWRERPFAALWAHEETGVRWTFARDRRVARWARERGVAFVERPQTGVVRGRAGPEARARLRAERLAGPPLPAPARLVAASGYGPGAVPSATDLGVGPERVEDRQRGGSTRARALLEAFLARGGAGYAGGLCGPEAAAVTGSRLSPHLALGTISFRTVLAAAAAAADRAPPGAPARAAFARFRERLLRHAGSAQRLEDAPRLEFEAEVAGRPEGAFDDERFAAWAEGRTGVAIVDAGMRCLRATAWVNFRLRALLVHHATRVLGLPWRPVGLHLARAFLDYDPGIHWPHVQAQAGVGRLAPLGGLDAGRLAAALDPDGSFVRRWVPEAGPGPAPGQGAGGGGRGRSSASRTARAKAAGVNGLGSTGTSCTPTSRRRSGS